MRNKHSGSRQLIERAQPENFPSIVAVRRSHLARGPDDGINDTMRQVRENALI